MTFSEKLTELRRKSGMSQEQLADRLGVTRQSVSKWEGGTAMPELVKLISLSELFGVSVDYLVKDWMEEPDEPCERKRRRSLRRQADRLETKGGRADQLCEGQGLPLRQQDPDLRPAPGVHPVRLRPEREAVHG